MKVHEIAEQCGFYDQSHFIRTFKRLRRQTPAQYRRVHFSDSTTPYQLQVVRSSRRA